MQILNPNALSERQIDLVCVVSKGRGIGNYTTYHCSYKEQPSKFEPYKQTKAVRICLQFGRPGSTLD